jgi:hypothetical protein
MDRRSTRPSAPTVKRSTRCFLGHWRAPVELDDARRAGVDDVRRLDGHVVGEDELVVEAQDRLPALEDSERVQGDRVLGEELGERGAVTPIDRREVGRCGPAGVRPADGVIRRPDAACGTRRRPG